MKALHAAVLAAGLISAAPAFSAAVTIDFDGPASFSFIDNYYAGSGVLFGLDAMAVQNDGLGGGVNGEYFTHAPSPIGTMSPVGPDATMNVASGFNGVASLYFSSPEAAIVNIWSGLDGTGSVLGSFNLTNNAQAGCDDSPYCNWELLSFNLGANVAHSITFGSANLAGFDNVAINTVPIPAALPLLSFGLAGMGALMRRRKKAAV